MVDKTINTGTISLIRNFPTIKLCKIKSGPKYIIVQPNSPPINNEKFKRQSRCRFGEQTC